jgi:hypothetical protein
VECVVLHHHEPRLCGCVPARAFSSFPINEPKKFGAGYRVSEINCIVLHFHGSNIFFPCVSTLFVLVTNTLSPIGIFLPVKK